MRLIPTLILMCLPAVALANPPHSGARPDMSVEWSNSQPEQRQALDNFYQALQQMPPGAGNPDINERQRHLEQLRDMSTEQRQEMFRNFVQDAESRR
ncbi:MAG: hypothetical protein QF808_03245 [Thalassolituus sp.]|uniref:hypothetical protein n=1 Tax=Thalassolituus sp. TaxID=2030822 RepID=UPI0027D58513|nr:hypothetical protein [Thalassolituus sp.]MDQ4422903.1 hypothetical protein [Thalassolituus sp.]MDQ4427155.1 hypothetical protein [Thalassolituus sp.]